MRPKTPLLVALAAILIMAACIMMSAIAPRAALASSSWTDCCGPGNGYAKALACDSTHNILHRGTSTRGVWKYDGAIWTDTGGAISSYDIESLADDSTHNLLYAGCSNFSTGLSHGVWKYDGATWSSIGMSTDVIRALYYDFVHKVLYAGTDRNGFWLYDGTGWTNTGGGISSHRIDSIGSDSTCNVLFAGACQRPSCCLAASHLLSQ
jgi:hypothetical protein